MAGEEMVARIGLDDRPFEAGVGRVERRARQSAERIQEAYRRAASHVPRDLDRMAGSSRAAFSSVDRLAVSTARQLTGISSAAVGAAAAVAGLGAAATLGFRAYLSGSRDARIAVEQFMAVNRRAAEESAGLFGRYYATSALPGLAEGGAAAARGLGGTFSRGLIFPFARPDDANAFIAAAEEDAQSDRSAAARPLNREAELRARIVRGRSAGTPEGLRDAAEAEAALERQTALLGIQSQEGLGREQREALAAAAQEAYRARLAGIERQDFGQGRLGDSRLETRAALLSLQSANRPEDFDLARRAAEAQRDVGLQDARRSADREVGLDDRGRYRLRADREAVVEQAYLTQLAEIDRREQELAEKREERAQAEQKRREEEARRKQEEADRAKVADRAAELDLRESDVDRRLLVSQAQASRVGGADGRRMAEVAEREAEAKRIQIDYERRLLEIEQDRLLTAGRRAELAAAAAGLRDAELGALRARPLESRASDPAAYSYSLGNGLRSARNQFLFVDSALGLTDPRKTGGPDGASRNLSTIGNQALSVLRQILDKLPGEETNGLSGHTEGR